MRLKPSLEDLIRSSLRSVLKNKSRTFLTALGVIIGVTSVILLTSIGTGLKKYVSDQFETLGSNTLFVAPGKLFNEKGGFSPQESNLATLSFTTRDVASLRADLDGAIVLPTKSTVSEVKSKNAKKNGVIIVGTTYQYGPHNNSLPAPGNGRWFTKEEDDKGSPVAILGPDIAKDLFPNGNALGKKIIIGSKNTRVIGINDSRGSSMGGPNLDEYIFVPFDLASSLSGDEKIQEIMVKAKNKNEVDATKNKVIDILSRKYDPDDFTVFDSAQLLTSINQIINTLTIALTGIAAISLIVGGIGIMNIMLVTVSERTREIGLRKAIGAYPRAILLQFLFEAVILSGLGGIIGIILGTLGTMAINKVFPAQVTPSSILLAFGVAFIVGIVFGVAPARRASKLSPIDALRYE